MDHLALMFKITGIAASLETLFSRSALSPIRAVRCALHEVCDAAEFEALAQGLKIGWVVQ